MALPSFITGANAKIKAGDITIAYAQDVSFNVTVTTIPIETMGRYEVVSNEPVAYFVDGTLSVIRYTKTAYPGMPNTAANGNSLGNWQLAETNQSADYGVNPGKMNASDSFTLDVYQKTPGEASDVNVIKVKQVRFTRKGGGINKRGVLVEQYAFNAIFQDDDVTATSPSGDDDLVT
jgi:hypothetical protein